MKRTFNKLVRNGFLEIFGSVPVLRCKPSQSVSQSVSDWCLPVGNVQCTVSPARLSDPPTHHSQFRLRVPPQHLASPVQDCHNQTCQYLTICKRWIYKRCSVIFWVFLIRDSLKPPPQWEWYTNFPLPFLSTKGIRAMKYQEVYHEATLQLLQEWWRPNQ